jgi:NAD(P)-dependent dehydrogenase (short-subunit alcohol dehydrogenase family)
MLRPVVVTGVSSGIGRAIARTLTASGVRVFGSVRREEDAAAFEAEFGRLGTALLFDLRDEDAIGAAAEKVHIATGGGIAALVNNAGIAVPGPLEHMPTARFREQLEIGLTGTLAVTKAFLPLLKGSGNRGAGRIVNISSVSGATALPFLGPYAAAKFGLEALSDSLRRELLVYGIDVVVIQPGGVATPVWRKAAAEDAGPLAGGAYERPVAAFQAAARAAGEGGIDPDRVATLVQAAIVRRRPRARYVITPHPVTERIMRRLPTRLLDRLIARRLGLRPRR